MMRSASSRVLVANHAPTVSSTIVRFFTRSVLVRNRGSSIISGLPIVSNSRFAIAWIEADTRDVLAVAHR